MFKMSLVEANLDAKAKSHMFSIIKDRLEAGFIDQVLKNINNLPKES